MCRTLVASLLLSLLPALAAEPAVSKGFDHFYNLEFDAAIGEFRAAVQREPNNPERWNHLAQSILYREMHRAGALESELVSGSNPFLRRAKMNPSAEDRAEFDEALRRSMTLAQDKLRLQPNDIPSLYALGVAHGLRANYNFLVRKAWRDALRDATEARTHHNRVTELNPALTDARLVQGVHDYVVGSLPWMYKMLGFLAGYRGDRAQGVKTLQLVAQKGDRNRFDAEVLLAAIYRRERRPADAIPLLSDMVRRFPRNYLLRLEVAQMQADAGNREAALEQYEAVERLKRSGAPGFAGLSWEKLYYYEGNFFFWYNDLDRALERLQKVTAKANELDPNTGVYAWMRLGQVHDLLGHRDQAIAAYRSAIRYAPESEAARESQRYIGSPYKRAPAQG